MHEQKIQELLEGRDSESLQAWQECYQDRVPGVRARRAAALQGGPLFWRGRDGVLHWHPAQTTAAGELAVCRQEYENRRATILATGLARLLAEGGEARC